MNTTSMTKELVILIADDDAGHTRLIEKNLSRAGLNNSTQRFDNGQQVLDFFFGIISPIEFLAKFFQSF